MWVHSCGGQRLTWSVFHTHTLYLLGQALLLHTKPEDSANLAIQFAQEPFVSGWAEITGQPSHPNCFPELWGSELRSALLHSWYFIHQAACLASYVKTLPETMYSLSSRDLVGFVLKEIWDALSTLGCPTAVFLLGAANSASLCCVFSSEFVVKIHFTNTLDSGKSVVLSQLLGSACHRSMTAAKMICKLMCLAVLQPNSEQQAGGGIWPLGSILLALVLHISDWLTSLDLILSSGSIVSLTFEYKEGKPKDSSFWPSNEMYLLSLLFFCWAYRMNYLHLCF